MKGIRKDMNGDVIQLGKLRFEFFTVMTVWVRKDEYRSTSPTLHKGNCRIQGQRADIYFVQVFLPFCSVLAATPNAGPPFSASRRASSSAADSVARSLCPERLVLMFTAGKSIWDGGLAQKMKE